MSDSDESNLGALLFGDEADVASPEYPIETLMVDRLANVREGITNAPFKPLFHCFDNLRVKTVPCAATTDPAVTERTPQFHEDIGADGESVEDQLAALSARLEGLQPEPVTVHYRNKHHSLWGHRLWNAAKYLAKRIDQRCIDVRGKRVLELGAGLGVPSLVAYRNGASVVVVTDYPDDDLIDILRLNAQESCTPAKIDADVASATASLPVIAVEPLLWGKREHIKKAMDHTAGAGFDVVILSDILFNHVCNDDLVETILQTLSNKPSAAGYCVFSHHRAYKQLQDFEFFDKCVARGLAYEQVDEQDYPMMFPDDRGPSEVRMPVKCYKITRRYDHVGPPIDLTAIFAAAEVAGRQTIDTGAGGQAAKPQFDAVILGTGLAQSLLSAALARSGLVVLHCDGEAQYGGVHATRSLPEFTAYLRRMARVGGGEGGAECARARTGEAHLFTRPHVPGTTNPRILIDSLTDAPVGTSATRYLVDVLPASYTASGALIQQLVRSDMARTLELQNLGGFLFLTETVEGAAGGLEPTLVPLTRADVFATGAIGLLEKRRLMRFVKDVEASLAEQLHAKSASPADSAEIQREAAARAAAEAAATFAKQLDTNRELTLTQLLQERYGLSGRALDCITLMGELDQPRAGEGGDTAAAEPGLLRSIHLVRELLLSVGAYGGSTPFLIPSYGASELAQNICRTSAVWGSVFVLARGVSRIYMDEEKETQYAVLTNGQHIPARTIVVPAELTRPVPVPAGTHEEGGGRLASLAGSAVGAVKLPLPVLRAGWECTLNRERRRAAGTLDEGLSDAELAALVEHGAGDVQLSRVVIISQRPLITAADLRRAKGGKADAGEQAREPEEVPVVMGLVRATLGGTTTITTTAAQPVVHMVQHSAGSDQVSPRSSSHVILHFTANARALSQAKLERFVEERFLVGTTTTTTTGATTDGAGGGLTLHKDKDVLYLASFTLSAMQSALDAIYGDGPPTGSGAPFVVDIPSATRESHAYAVAECEKLQRAKENGRRRVRGETTDEDAEASRTSALAMESTSSQQPGVVSPFLQLIGVPTLSTSLLDDGQYVAEAARAYEQVVDVIAARRGLTPEERREKFIFMEKLPPPPQVTGSD